MTIPQFIDTSKSTQTAFHNLCTIKNPPPKIHQLLSLSLKFNLEHALPKPKLDTYMERWRRDIRIKFHINANTNRVVTYQNGKVHTLKSTGYDPKLYIKSQDYKPDEASHQIKNAINAFEQSLLTLVRSNNATVTRKHNLPASSRLLLKQLKSNNDFIILATDKNLGPAILERQVYIQHCL
jgi:hypothetical protein